MVSLGHNLRRLTPRFSLRFLLLAVTLLCVWLGIRVNRARDQQMAVESLRQVGVHVRYSFQIPPKGLTGAQLFNWSPPPIPTDSSWLRGLVGEKFFRKVHSVSLCESNIAAMPRDLLAHLAKTPEIRFLGLSDTRITNADLKHLERLHNLEMLSLDCPSVTDEGLRYISGLTNLQHLTLSGDGVTDAGLRYISGLTNLEHLTLSGSGITDAGLQYISGLTNLESLTLEGEGINDAGVRHLWNLKKLRAFQYKNTWIQDDALRELWNHLPLLEPEF